MFDSISSLLQALFVHQLYLVITFDVNLILNLINGMLNRHRRNQENVARIPDKYLTKPESAESGNKQALRKSNVGRIVKNQSIGGRADTNYSNQSSRAFNELPVERNQSRNKERDVFLERFKQMRCRYQMIDEYLYQQINKLDQGYDSSLRAKRGDGQEGRSYLRTLENSRRQRYTQERPGSKRQPMTSKKQALKQNRQPHKPKKQSYENIAKQLKTQINLQGKLRELKHKINQKNSAAVKKILSNKYKIEEQKYSLTVEEFDPFLVQVAESNPEELARDIRLSVEECESNWIRKLSRVFPRGEVESLFKRLDFQKQGHLTLNVFVREMSMVLNMNFRKRDLWTVFMRLSGDTLVTGSSFLKTLSML